MTDGRDGPRSQDDAGGSEIDGTPKAAARTGQAESSSTESRETEHITDLPSDDTRRESDSGADHSRNGRSGSSEQQVLAEPTSERLTRQRARASTLERGPITEYTTTPRSLDAKVQIQWTIRVVIYSFILGLIGTAILGNFGVPPQFGAIAIGLILALGMIWVVLSYRIWTYQIRDDSVYLERGVVTHVRTVVPYVRIQHVDTSRSALERALGLSTLVVYTAGSRGADVSVPGLQPEEARDLQQRLKELAIEADGDDAL